MKEEISPDNTRQLFTPFPVSLITVGDNIVTVALVHIFSFRPLMIGIGLNPKRHSHGLLKKVKDFGVNLPTTDMVKVVDGCGSVSGRDIDKFKKFALTPMKAKFISSLLITECPLNIECKVIKEIETGGSHEWFIGEVLAAHKDEAYSNKKMLTYWNKEYYEPGKVLFTRGPF